MNHVLASVLRWFDDEAGPEQLSERNPERTDILRILPFLILHTACFGITWVGWSTAAVTRAIELYVFKMPGITGTYHRYISHRTYKMSGFWQFIFTIISNSSAQGGPLRLSARHQHHHSFSDKPENIYSPVHRGFLCIHILWILTPEFLATNKKLVKSRMNFPELVLLNRFSTLVPLILLLVLYLSGEMLRIYVPSTGITGIQMVILGFCISTAALFYATAKIDSLSHIIGRRRYSIPEHSYNNLFPAIVRLDEWQHNNHHYYPTIQDFFCWKPDITYYLLVFLSWLGIVYDLTPLPE